MTQKKEHRDATYVENFLCFGMASSSKTVVEAREKEQYSGELPTHPAESGQDAECVALSLMTCAI